MKFRFCFIIFCITSILIFTVYLRSASNRIFYLLSQETTEQARLRQQLGNKQLQIENLINPSAISGTLEEHQH